MSPIRSFDFCKETRAKIAVPVHARVFVGGILLCAEVRYKVARRIGQKFRPDVMQDAHEASEEKEVRISP
jgi:hypothetical protein